MIVCGFFGCGGSNVAKRVAALGGWRHTDVYEHTAHMLGEHRAMAGISLENPEWARAEEQVIERALRSHPHGIIGLTDGYLPDERMLSLMQRCADLVTIRLDWLELQERLLQEIETAPERLPEFMEQEIPDLHTLQILYRYRTPLYENSAITVDAHGLTPGIVAHRVNTAISRLS